MTRFHLVPHTHWDREWYKSADAFRVHLLGVVDAAVAGRDPFLLDGQGIVLDDYLAWVPEQRDSLARALQSGRIEAGPWFVLADNLIPSGEALVRNLLAGRASLGRLGAVPPPVLYCPDTFGHPALAPILAAGFGLPVAIVWRGYGGRGWPPGDSARWRAADGSEVLIHHLPASGYEFGASLPAGAGAAETRVRELQAVLGARSASGELLVLNGADHHAPPVDQEQRLAAFRAAAAPALTELGGIRGFARAQQEWAAGHAVPVVAGELRASPSFVWALPGTLGSRAAQKRENAHLERALLLQVEPLLSLARWSGQAEHVAARGACWRLLLENHPHDTLCGCSIDDVARAMDERARRVRHAAGELSATVVQQLVAPARTSTDPGVPAVALVNPLPRPRQGLVELTIEVPEVRVGVGPGSSPVVPQVPRRATLSVGNLPVQVLRREVTFARDEHPERYPRNVLATRYHAIAWVDSLAPHAVRVEALGTRRARRALPDPCRVTPGGHLTNGHLTMWYDEAHGLCCASGGRTITDLLHLESEGERGDLYTHAPIPGSRSTGRVIRVRVAHRGPLRGELRLTWRVPVAPRELVTATGEPVRHPAGHIDVDARVQLDAGRHWFRVVLEGANTQRDVRLRAVVRTGCRATTHLADAGFGPIVRRSSAPASQPGDVEILPPTAPLHRYVSCFDAVSGAGVTVFSDGLAEYEATPHGEVAVTLLRAVGELSRPDLIQRPGHAGWPQATPLAQCQGPFAAVLAVGVHGPDTPTTRDVIERMADDVLVPPTGHLVRDATVGARDGLSVAGRGLRVLACKPPEQGDGVIVRFANVTGSVQAAECRLPGVTRAWLVRLDETTQAALAVREDRVQLDVQPHAVITLRLVRDASS